MATIYNSELSKELIEAAKIQTSRDSIPTQIADKVVPVMEVNPKMLRRIDVVKYGISTDSTSDTVYTTPTDRDFYLSAYNASVFKTAAAAATAHYLRAYINGVQTRICEISTTSGVAVTGINQANSFAIPMKIDRGTVIDCGSNNAATLTRITCTIFGFVDSTSKA